MRPHGSPLTLERRRRRAITLLRGGHTFRDVAERLDASLSSVVRWCQSYRRWGRRGLSPRPTPGRPCRLNNRQMVRLGDVLARGAQAAGYPNELWTLKRIAAIVAEHFGIRYCESAVWRLLRSELRWSSQKPERRATQRDEEAIAHWKRYVWPRIKKAWERRAHLAFLDESGFLLIPTVRRTWGPIGQTPIVRHSYRHDRLSVISAITVSPRRCRLALYAQFHRRNITGEEVVEFLGYLLRHVLGPIELVWDGGPIHRRRSVAAFLRRHYPRLQVHRFPAYAPEINPDEYVWTRSKQRLANTTPQTFDQLDHGVRHTIKAIRRSQHLLWSCIHEADLPW